MCYVFFFFFKQKTAFAMRISDWSSDVCSSDLKLIGTCLRKAQCHADLGIGQSLHPMHLESPPLALGQFGKRAMKRLQLFAPFHCSISVHSKIDRKSVV